MAATSNYADAVPIFKRAISLDPNFAMGYASLATCYFTMGNANAMEENARKAFELRERVSQREKYYIESQAAASGSSPVLAPSPSSTAVKVAEISVAGGRKPWKILVAVADCSCRRGCAGVVSRWLLLFPPHTKLPAFPDTSCGSGYRAYGHPRRLRVSLHPL